MSELKVEVLEVLKVETHPNADRLDIVTVLGWQCVVQKDSFKVGDPALYFPIDSILPQAVEEKIFGIGSKVKLSKSRVKTIKLRGAISQGLLVDPALFDVVPRIGNEVTKYLGVKKYEPPQHMGPQSGANTASRKQTNPNFHKYTSIENFKNYPTLFSNTDDIIATEKIHGTNFRCGWVPFHANTLWKKIKKFFKLVPKWEFVYGSHNVQLQDQFRSNNFYQKQVGKNVYAEAVEKYNLKELLMYGEVIYGEIYGDGIQKGYTYGCKPGERKLIIFDVRIQGIWLPFFTSDLFCSNRGIPFTKPLFLGNFDAEYLKGISSGPSVLSPEQKIREGIVIRPVIESECYMGRKILKMINDEYLLKDQSDFH